MQKPFLVTNFKEELWIITMIYVMMTGETDDWIGECMDPSQVGNQSLCIIYSMHRGKFIFLSQVFSK